MSRMTWRHQYDDEIDEAIGLSTATRSTEESLTEQHHAELADINNIVASFGITDGAIPPVALDPRFFGNFADVPDFRTALDATRVAQQRFDALPADLRRRFNHDPVELWEFVSDPRHTAEAIELGLLKRGTVVNGEVVPTPEPAPAPTPAPSGAST